MSQDTSSTPRRHAQGEKPSGAGTPPPGASEPSPPQPKTPPRDDPEASDPMAQGGGEDLPEGEYGTAAIKDKPRH